MQSYLLSNLNNYSTALKGLMAKGESNYVCELFKRFLSLSEKKIEKNDIIDSIYMKYYPKMHLITYDRGILDNIKILDKNYFNEIEQFLKICK